MGSQSGDIGTPGPRLCACGAVISRRETRCERCKDLHRAKIDAARARRRDREHRRQVAEYRRQQAEHSRETKTYRPACTECGKRFPTRSKTRRVCGGCMQTAPGFQEKMGDAARRGIGFSLTLQQWESLRGQSCAYCGDTFEGVRVDRVDSDGAYTAENVVSCCTPCNMMKRTMPLDVFQARIAQMARHMGLIDEE